MAKSLLLVLLSVLLLLVLSAASVSAHGGDHDSDADADSGDGDSPNLRSKSLILVKVWCLILIFVGTFIGGVSPYFFKWNEGFLVLGTQFAGGVFLGTALMHFLSDANETFEELTDKAYPFAFMLASAGYVITMLADSVISMVVTRGRSVRDVEGGATVGDRGKFQESKVISNGGGSQLQPEAECTSGHQSLASMLRDADTLGDSILLIVALCFHSVFEGIAIGVAVKRL